jgi:hypothetical protein
MTINIQNKNKNKYLFFHCVNQVEPSAKWLLNFSIYSFSLISFVSYPTTCDEQHHHSNCSSATWRRQTIRCVLSPSPHRPAHPHHSPHFCVASPYVPMHQIAHLQPRRPPRARRVALFDSPTLPWPCQPPNRSPRAACSHTMHPIQPSDPQHWQKYPPHVAVRAQSSCCWLASMHRRHFATRPLQTLHPLARAAQASSLSMRTEPFSPCPAVGGGVVAFDDVLNVVTTTTF